MTTTMAGRPLAPGWAELSRTPRALFLDIDGTLVEFESHPDMVRAAESLIMLLTNVASVLHDALALLSGRSLTDIDRVFSPWQPYAAGVHGAEVRGSEGVRRHLPDPTDLARLRESSMRLAEELPGMWVEDKGMSVALHHRDAPELGPRLSAEAQHLAQASGGTFVVQPGVMVQELRPAAYDKGLALVELLEQLPFHGRSPIVVGDDRTDEFAFAAAQKVGGIAILVGNRNDTHATFGLPNPEAVRGWLAELIEEVRT